MRRMPEKLLAVLLTLMLGLSPLQGVMAGSASSLDQEKGVHQMSTQGEMVMNIDHGSHSCEQCHAGDGCNGHSCSSGQCASCALALLPSFSLPVNLTVVTLLLRSDQSSVSQYTSFLFRPPRA